MCLRCVNVVILDELRSRNDGLNEWGRMTSVGIRYHREEYRLHKTVRSHYVVYLYNLLLKNNKIYQDLILSKRENTIYVENITVFVFVLKTFKGLIHFFRLGFWYNDKNIFLMFSGKVFDQNIINGPIPSY